jgi:hypothetical protein
MKAAVCCAISSIEVGTSPLELETPAFEQDHFAVLGKSVGQCGIPVIHCSREVHEEEQRDVDLCAEAAVGEATVRESNASGLNELRRRRLVCVAVHEISIGEI